MSSTSPTTLRSPPAPWATKKYEPLPHLAADSPTTIGLRRRESASFKTMSTGSLVSNSPFTKRLGASGAAPSPSPSASSPMRTPTVSAPTPAPSAEPMAPPVAPALSHNFLYSTSRIPTSAAAHPATRRVSNENESQLAPASPVLGSPSKATQPPRTGVTTTPSEPPRAASASPFRPRRPSPPLPAVPYEIPALTKESAPFNTYPTPRRTVGAVHPPSSLSPGRRIRGPRGESPQMETSTPTAGSLRGSPAKTVTWAATEEVLEFEVDDDRRESGASSLNSYASNDVGSSDDEVAYPYGYGSDDEDVTFEEGGSLVVHDVGSAGHLAAELSRHATLHGGELDDYYNRDEKEDDTESAASSSAVADVIGAIDSYLHDQNDDFFRSPSKASSTPGPMPGLFRPGGTTTSTFSDVLVAPSEESSYDSEQDDDDTRSLPSLGPSQPPPPKSLDTPKAPLLDPSSSTYSLPDLPENSPFLGFEDTGEASSVVTLDLAPKLMTTSAPLYRQAEAPLYRQSEAPLYRQAEASLYRQADDSPILNSFRGPSSTEAVALSREASIVNPSSAAASDVGSTATTSTTSSSISRFALRSEQLASRLAANELLLNSTPHLSTFSPNPDVFSPLSGISTVSRFPSPPPPLGVPAPPTPTPVRTARLADKAVPATLNQGMLDASTRRKGDEVVGGVLTSELAEGMESPLERLGRRTWESDATKDASGGAQEGQQEDEEEDEEEEEEEEEEEDALARLQRPVGGSSRRRSRSTGDVRMAAKSSNPVAGSSTMEKRVTMPELGFRGSLDDALPGVTSEFSSSVENSLSHIFANRDRNYRVRETTRVVYANDRAGVETVGKAGDVDLGKTWRKKRPSDMHLSRSLSTVTISGKAPKDRLAGVLYITVLRVEFSGLSLPTQPVVADLLVDNGKVAQPIRAHSFALAPAVTLGRKLELDTSTDLLFHVDITVPKLSALPAATHATPPPSPKKLHGFRSMFSSSPIKRSPKKQSSSASLSAAASAGNLADYLSPSGGLARVSIRFAEQAAKCRTTQLTLQLPLVAPPDGGGRPVVRGRMTIDLFYLPKIRGVEPGPKTTVESVMEALAAADRQLRLHHEGVLTQQGGDCTTWRRRLFKARGMSLVPYSEVLKRAYVEIDLSTATAVVDPDEPATPTTGKSGLTLVRSMSQDIDEDPYRMDNGFKLVFADDSEIHFFADTPAEKTKWLEVLRSLVGKVPPKTKLAPEWAMRYRQLSINA